MIKVVIHAEIETTTDLVATIQKFMTIRGAEGDEFAIQQFYAYVTGLAEGLNKRETAASAEPATKEQEHG